MTPTPYTALRDAIARWEGGWQANPDDAGNWITARDGSRKLIGTMRGVTPDTYAAYIGAPAWTLTPEIMQREITPDVAAGVGVDLFYRKPGFDRLEWSPLVEIAVDIGWGSGPVRGVRMLQEVVGTVPDGVIGPKTAAAVRAANRSPSLPSLVDALSNARRVYYLRISEPGSRNAGFRTGWLRRADWYLTSNAAWWGQWEGWRPEGVGTVEPPVDTPVEPRRDTPAPEPERRGLLAWLRSLFT